VHPVPDLPARWLGHYDAGVSASLAPYPNRTLIDYVAELARTHPQRSAILFKGARLSYADLHELSDACASALRAIGVERGHRIALLLPNCPQFCIAEIGAWKAGAQVAPLNPIYSDAELEFALREQQIDTIITLTRFYGRIKRLQPKTALRRVIATNIKDFFPAHLRLLFTLLREKRDGDRVRVAADDFVFSRLLAEHRGRRLDEAPPLASDAAVLLMSGGTTGTPKGVVGDHGAYTMAGLQLQAWMASALAPGDVVLLPLPLFHVYANVGVQSFAFVTGSTLALVPNPRDLDDLLTTVGRVKPAFFNGVPALYVSLLAHPRVRRGSVSFKPVKICFSGAAPLMAETKSRFEALTGGRLVEGYSLTEAMMATCVNPVRGPNKAGSVGMPLPDVFVRIVDGENGTTVLPSGVIGEVCLSAPQLMRGFWSQPDETALALRHHADTGADRLWLHTGDLGYVDEDGYVFIVDRKKDLIKTSGFQVWPREVEEALSAHPAVSEAGVAGVPDPAKGEAVKAWVVLRPGQHATDAELRSHCRTLLAPYKVPTHIEFRTELPKTMVGKVLRRALRDS
jgi:long-chain acyl-CoA synthetase